MGFSFTEKILRGGFGVPVFLFLAKRELSCNIDVENEDADGGRGKKREPYTSRAGVYI